MIVRYLTEMRLLARGKIIENNNPFYPRIV